MKRHSFLLLILFPAFIFAAELKEKASKDQLSILLGSYVVVTEEESFGDLGAFSLQYAHLTESKLVLSTAFTSFFSADGTSSSIFGFDFGAGRCLWGKCFQEIESLQENLSLKRKNQGVIASLKLSQRTVQFTGLSSSFIGPGISLQYLHPMTEQISFTVQTHGSYLLGSESNIFLNETLVGASFNF